MGTMRPEPANPPIRRSLRFRNRKQSRVEYNSRGKITRFADPIGRETVLEYAPNEIDLLRTSQKNGSVDDLLEARTYNSAHLPLTVKDTAGQTTTYTYNTEGQLLSATTPQRVGITENRTTTWSYDANGYLQSVTRPATGATTSFTYDSYGRTRTVTDSDAFVLTFDYDALDRQTKVSYPDSTYEEAVYERLDLVRSRDRLARWSHRVYDALGRVIATTDPLGRTVTHQWCGCGSLDALIDANGNTMSWTRDLQGRVTKEIRANSSEWVYAYETTTSRLKSVTDPKGQVKTYGYFVDNNLSAETYTNEEHTTPDVSYTYELVFNRMATMADGTGTTTYIYHPVGESPTFGAGRLASVNGPLTNDTITYAYDELGRVASRVINGIALTYEYDSLGRTTTETNVLGTFSYQYDDVTSRLETVTYPNGQTSSYTYYGNSGDHRLQEIHHRQSGGTTLSKFGYTYDAVGNIKTWTQQHDTSTAKAYDFESDGADQLRNAVWRTADATPTVLTRYAYQYDPAGNRTVEQIDNAPVLSAYDNVNRLSSQTPGGTMRFAGTLNEAATVTIQGAPVTVTSDDRFAGGAQVGSGTTQVVVNAKDYSGNERTNTYEVSVSGSAKTFTFDANGNMTGDGARTFEWDAENRLVAIVDGTLRTEFTYNGHHQRYRVLEKNDTVITSDEYFVWCDLGALCEERASDGTTINKRFFDYGVNESGGAFFYTRDHLDSIREMTDSSGAVRARYEYDPYGRRVKVSGDKDTDAGYTGHYHISDLILAQYRAYDSETGRWISEDPITARVRSLFLYPSATRAMSFLPGNAPTESNPYLYVANRSTNLVDPLGLQPETTGPRIPPSCGPQYDDRWDKQTVVTTCFLVAIIPICLYATASAAVLGLAGGLAAGGLCLIVLGGTILYGDIEFRTRASDDYVDCVVSGY